MCCYQVMTIAWLDESAVIAVPSGAVVLARMTQVVDPAVAVPLTTPVVALIDVPAGSEPD